MKLLALLREAIEPRSNVETASHTLQWQYFEPAGSPWISNSL
jgi:hypothetical protein